MAQAAEPGWRCCRASPGRPSLASTFILFPWALVGLSQSPARGRGWDSGAALHLLKPISSPSLRSLPELIAPPQRAAALWHPLVSDSP